MTFRATFTTPFEQHADREGQKFAVLRKIIEPDETHDTEVLPMYRIRFADGFETDAWPEEVERVSQDPDGLDCYSDHEHDILTVGECSMCGSTEPNVIGHVLPDVERIKGVDPVEAAEQVMQSQSAKIFDGVLLDHFTAQHIVAVSKALGPEALAKLRTMPLVKAGIVCLKLAEKFGTPA